MRQRKNNERISNRLRGPQVECSERITSATPTLKTLVTSAGRSCHQNDANNSRFPSTCVVNEVASILLKQSHQLSVCSVVVQQLCCLSTLTKQRKTGFSDCTKMVPVKSHDDFSRPRCGHTEYETCFVIAKL